MTDKPTAAQAAMLKRLRDGDTLIFQRYPHNAAYRWRSDDKAANTKTVTVLARKWWIEFWAGTDMRIITTKGRKALAEYEAEES